MSTIRNTDYQTILSQIQGSYGQLGLGAGSGSGFMNSVFTAGSDIDNIVNGNDSQRASALKGLVNKAISLLDKLTTQEAKAATNEVNNDKKAADKLAKEQAKAQADLEDEIENIGEEINDQSKVVTDASKDIQKSNEKMLEKQKEINEIIKKIEALQTALATETDPAKKADLLNKIKGLSTSISDVVESITDIQTEVEEASNNVEQAVTEIETAKGNAVEIQSNGEMKITEIAQEGAKQVQNNVNSNATGNINIQTGAAAEQAAEAPTNVAIAAKLYKVSFDQKTAGEKRTTGAVQNLQTLQQGIGGLNNNASLLSTFKTSIGGALDTFAGNVQGWNTALESTITAFGSFETVKQENETLQSSIETDLSTLTGDNTEIQEENETENDSQNDNIQVSENGLLTPNTKINMFKIEK